MSKIQMKPGDMLSPVPAALVSVRGKDGRSNLLTIAWAGTICSDPPMLSISVRKSRFSHPILMETREFVVNLTTADMLRAVDLCGVISGRDVDKWEKSGFHEEEASVVKAPLVKESPLSLECRVTQVLELGSHDMFLAEIVAVDAEEAFFDEKGKFDLGRTNLVAYTHGEYRVLGKLLGTFGYSVRKKKGKEKKK